MGNCRKHFLHIIGNKKWQNLFILEIYGWLCCKFYIFHSSGKQLPKTWFCRREPFVCAFSNGRNTFLKFQAILHVEKEKNHFRTFVLVTEQLRPWTSVLFEKLNFQDFALKWFCHCTAEISCHVFQANHEAILLERTWASIKCLKWRWWDLHTSVQGVH